MHLGLQGVLHIALKAKSEANYEEILAFYGEMLGCPTVRAWGEGKDRGAILDLGNTQLEVWASGGEALQTGVIAHIAFRAANVDEALRQLREAGRPVIMEPTELSLLPGYPIRVAFITGPAGEEIELFQEL